jgi:hypothetical protein
MSRPVFAPKATLDTSRQAIPLKMKTRRNISPPLQIKNRLAPTAISRRRQLSIFCTIRYARNLPVCRPVPRQIGSSNIG